MELQELKVKVFESITGILGMEELDGKPEDYFDMPLFVDEENEENSFGLDSIDAIEVIIAIKKCFGIKIDNEHMGVIKTISSIAEYVMQNQN
jgi:acyl carrier protein